MTTHDFLAVRRKELVEFFSWRFGTKFWTGPAAYCTSLPRWIFVKLRRKTIEYTSASRPGRGVTVRDIIRAEIAARHLGFRPTYPSLMRYRMLKPPPINLPKWTHREVKIRFRQWQKETGNLPSPSQARRRKRERKRIESSPPVEVGNICMDSLPTRLYGDTDTVVKSSHSDELKNNGSNNIGATQVINPLPINDPSV